MQQTGRMLPQKSFRSEWKTAVRCCRFEDRTACSLRKLEEQSEVGVEDLSDIQDEHHNDDTL